MVVISSSLNCWEEMSAWRRGSGREMLTCGGVQRTVKRWCQVVMKVEGGKVDLMKVRARCGCMVCQILF